MERSFPDYCLKALSIGRLVLITIGGSVVARAEAASMTFNNRTDFNNATGILAVESFESTANDVADGPRTLTFPLFDASWNQSSLFEVNDAADAASGLGATDGSKYLRANYENGTGILTFSFDHNVLAFGTDIKDIDTTVADLLYQTDTGLSGTAASHTGNGGVAFFGLTSDSPFRSISFSLTFPSSPLAIDGVMYDAIAVTPVPLPTAVLPALAAFGMLGGARTVRGRRRMVSITS